MRSMSKGVLVPFFKVIIIVSDYFEHPRSFFNKQNARLIIDITAGADDATANMVITNIFSKAGGGMVLP